MCDKDCSLNVLTEYTFEDFTKVEDVFPDGSFRDVKRNCKTKSYALAEEAVRVLRLHGVMSSVVTFENDAGFTLWSELDRKHKTYTTHSVVLVGDFVLDIDNCGMVIRTGVYVEDLVRRFSNLRIVESKTGNWWDAEGKSCQITLDKLLSGNW